MEALGDQFIEEMRELSETGGNKKIHHLKKELAVVEKRNTELDSIVMKLFEQNALSKIIDERFEKMSATYEPEETGKNKGSLLFDFTAKFRALA